jgi:hypothetical protein
VTKSSSTTYPQGTICPFYWFAGWNPGFLTEISCTVQEFLCHATTAFFKIPTVFHGGMVLDIEYSHVDVKNWSRGS